ncbi:hypothetical protein Tco_1547603 [Tanacetum coccineum]
MNQNFNSFGFDHIQPPQQFDNHQPQEIPEVTPFVESKEWIETNNELYTIMEDFMKRMNQQREQEALLVAQREQELREQEQAAQEKEELSPNFIFRQLIEEMCGTRASAEQKQNMEDTMLDLLEICRQKELYCMHNNVEDLIESALNSKLLLINLNSQRLNKEEQEVKNIAELAAKRQTRITSCLQNFKVISKESTIPLNKTPQISPVNAITHDLPTEEPKDSLIMGNEELSTILEKESDEFIKSSVEDLIPIPRKSEDTSGSDGKSVLPSSNDFSPIFEEKSVTFSNPLFDSNDFTSSENELLSDEDVPKEVKIYSNSLFEFDDEYIFSDVNPLFDEVLRRDSDGVCDVPLCDNPTPLKAFKDHSEIVVNSNNDDTSSDDDDFEDIKYVEASPPDLEIVSLEESTSPFPIPDSNSFFEKSDTSLSYSDNSLPEFESFSDHTEETSSGSTTTHANNSLPEYIRFHFKTSRQGVEAASALGCVFVFALQDFLQDHEARACFQSIQHHPVPQSFAYFGILNPDHVQRIENKAKTLRTRSPKKGKCSFMSIYPKTWEALIFSVLEQSHSKLQSFECSREVSKENENGGDSPRNTPLDRVEVLGIGRINKSSVENLVPIPSESEVTSDNKSECDVPVDDESSPTFTTFSNPLFDSNDDFTSSDDESLSDEDVPKENFKIYSNPLFDDEEIISTKIDPHSFNAESNFIESLLNRDTLIDSSPKFDYLLEEFSGELAHIDPIPPGIKKADFDLEEEIRFDECFDPRGVIDEIDAFLDMDISTDIENGYHDLEGDIFYLESLLIDDTSPNLPPKVFLDRDPRSLKDEPDNDDLMTEDQVFNPGINEKNFSPTFVKLTFEDHHYFPIAFFIRIFLPYLTYSVDYSFLLSSGSEDTIFDPDISTFHFSSLKPVAYENPIVIFLFFCFRPKDKGIRGESS